MWFIGVSYAISWWCTPPKKILNPPWYIIILYFITITITMIMIITIIMIMIITIIMIMIIIIIIITLFNKGNTLQS